MAVIEKISNGVAGKKISLYSETEAITIRDISNSTLAINPNLKLWMKFDGNFDDETGNHASFTSDGASLQTTGQALGSGCLSYGNNGAGYDEATLISDDISPIGFGLEDFVISFRYKANEVALYSVMGQKISTWEKWFISLDSNWGTAPFIFAYYKSSGEKVFYSFPLPDDWHNNSWRSFVFVRNGNNAYLFYDGVSIAHSATADPFRDALPLNNLNKPFILGKIDSGTQYPWLDEVMIYTGTDLEYGGESSITLQSENSGMVYGGNILTSSGNDIIVPINSYIDLLCTGSKWITQVVS